MTPNPPPRSALIRRRASAVAALIGGTALALLAALPAGAHVHVHADETEAGSYSALTLRVPNESDDARTVELSVQLPQGTPFASVRSRALPGWRAVLVTAPLRTPVEVGGTTLTEAVRTVTWTATTDAAILPGQYQDFALSVGPLPGAGEVLLPTTQTYSDGEVVRWNEPTPKSGPEPERPAPALEIVAADSGAAGQRSDAAASTSSAADPGARWLGAGALAGAVLATGVAALALRTARSARTARTDLTGRSG